MPFTDMVAYNDISAIGAMKAFAEAKLRIPQDVSVVGLIDGQEEYVQEIAVEPKLVVRGSTAAPPQAWLEQWAEGLERTKRTETTISPF